MIFLDKYEDIEWLFEVHLAEWRGTTLHMETACAVLHGNEDAPHRVELYTENHYQSIPTVFNADEETGELTP